MERRMSFVIAGLSPGAFALPVLRGRPVALRIFDARGMLIGADLALSGDPSENIRLALDNPQTAYIDAHNAAYGCFAARIRRA
ncbi:MAG: hypothetical protein Kow00133_09320 [Amphiplicatus sp.]